MFAASRIILLLVTSVFLTKSQSVTSSEINATRTSLDYEDEVDEALENMNFAEFKERYRRLIPYMTYFVANNYVNSQVLSPVQPSQQNYDRETQSSTSQLIRKPQRLLPLGRPSIDSRVKSNKYRTSTIGTSNKQTDNFVPSVQYDPKNIGSETDYFTPVRYNENINYQTVDYSDLRIANQYRQYEKSQQRPTQLYSDVTGSSSAILHQDSRNYERQPYNSIYERKYIPQKTKIDAHQDYLLDYGARISGYKAPIVNSDFIYPADNYEPLRYVKIDQPARNHEKPTRILAQSVPRRPYVLQPSPAIYPIGNNNPTASLDDIMKSLQLTDRLPEMLNKYNIDSSIKTLVEILSILHNAKQTDFPRPAGNFHQDRNIPNYHNFKQTPTRSKVVTETRFQATPSPSLIHDGQNSRYRPEFTYETSAKPNVRVNANYGIVKNNKQEHVIDPINTNYGIVENNKNENVIEYYTPLIHDIKEEKIPATNYETNESPVKIEEENEQTYEINGDPADDLLEREEEEKKYDLPMTTEMPISRFKLPGSGSAISKFVPPMMTLKYGATRGKPNIDYPAYAVIPKTEFNCKEQRYKGFFGDPSTGCQVWHYCDLNGGKSSFLCPNGTIFSQVALTCDWWFNVKCESTTQLYVLNERLYKYILPIMPKFPEDFSGPEVDRYLELKFKEMEAKLKEKKLKKQQEKDKIKEKLQGLESED